MSRVSNHEYIGRRITTAPCSIGFLSHSSGKAALRSGDYDKAIQYFETALNGKSNLEESQAGLLCTLRETGAYKDALKRAQQFLSTRGSSAAVELEFGRLLMLTGEYLNAEKHLRQSIALAPAKSILRMDAIAELACPSVTQARKAGK